MSVEDVICQECYAILESASLNVSSGSTVERVYGHQQVCFVCGISILRAKIHKVSIDSPEGNVIMSCIPTQQVSILIIIITLAALKYRNSLLSFTIWFKLSYVFRYTDLKEFAYVVGLMPIEV